MKYPKYILYCQEYNNNGESMDPDSWDDREYTFTTEEGLKKFVNEQFKCSFRVKAVYRLDVEVLSSI